MNEKMSEMWAQVAGSAGRATLGAAAYAAEMERIERRRRSEDESRERHFAACVQWAMSEVAYHVLACASAVTRDDWRYAEYHATAARDKFGTALTVVSNDL
jgi:hypothetical protein